jgi:hypothetical protein
MAAAFVCAPLTVWCVWKMRWGAAFVLWYYSEMCAAGAAGGALHYGHVIIGAMMGVYTLACLIGISYMAMYVICKPRPSGRGF